MVICLAGAGMRQHWTGPVMLHCGHGVTSQQESEEEEKKVRGPFLSAGAEPMELDG